jgi:hypothetical protein
MAGAAWIQRREAQLLDTEYFHVVFTVPEPIAVIAAQNKAVVYGISSRLLLRAPSSRRYPTP